MSRSPRTAGAKTATRRSPPSYAELDARVAALTAELRAALARESATAEVLQVINSSPGDLAPVFDAILEKALRLCDATHGHIWRIEGQHGHAVALRGDAQFIESMRRESPTSLLSDRPLGRLARGAHVVRLPDATKEELYRTNQAFREFIDASGIRSGVMVALRKDEALLGAIVVHRKEVLPFTDKQIALLQNFASQAVIAMENARLLTETREALEQQTATAEVLAVINSSPGDLAPVFDAILEKALRLCEAPYGHIWRMEDGQAVAVAARGDPDFTEWLRQQHPPTPRGSSVDRLSQGEPFVHVLDAREVEPYHTNPWFRELIDRGRGRTSIGVPLYKDGLLLGTFSIYRQEVRPFSDKQIALLQNFAAQAVIAMENARLLNETREALEQQTATAEVLQVINSSPGDLAPVFDAMLDKAMRLCDATCGHFFRFDGELVHAVAMRGDARLIDWLRQRGPVRPAPGSSVDRLIRGERSVHTLDATKEEAYSTSPQYRELIDAGNIRTSLVVPLRKDGALLGAIALYRQEVRPFSDGQITLFQNFAAQAVIAMENTRLLTETREALEQQTATAEVLQVINSSPGDLAPVFDAMLENATRLCDAVFGVMLTWDGERFHRVAFRGASAELIQALSPTNKPVPGSLAERIVNGETFVCSEDIREDNAYEIGVPGTRALADIGGARSYVTVALRKDNVLVGAINVYRQEVRPFTDTQIALLQNFAAQAVIAMENARLLTETREALERQTATAEVLQVINSSPGDLAPVFDAMLEKALRLCEASSGLMWSFDGERAYVRASRDVPTEFLDYLKREPPGAGPDTFFGRAIMTRSCVTSADITADEPYRKRVPLAIAAIELGGIRAVLMAPLVKDNTVFGVFSIFRKEFRPFTDKQIALLQNFAAQAVIAMENARLLTETREALEQQTATAEVLQVINSSPGDLAPVFDAMLEKALRLCGAAYGALRMWDGEYLTRVAWRAPHGFEDVSPKAVPAAPGSLAVRFVRGENVISISDLVDDANFQRSVGAQSLVHRGNARTFLGVALRKDDRLLGTLVIYRQEVRPFTDKQIALLQNFAAQAVIAIDNARLLNEIRQRQAELRVTFDNMGDGVAMFDRELRLAAWNQNFQRILDLPDRLLAERRSYADYIRFLAERGEFGADVEAELSRRLEEISQELRFEHSRPDGRVIEVRRNAVPGGGFVVIYGDVTERKRAEEEIRAARDTAERALRELQAAQTSLLHAQKMAALGQLTAGIAHEIKNPLNFVNNFAGLSVELLDELKETTEPAVASLGEATRAEIDEIISMLTGNLAKIAEHGKRADGIVQSMLAHSRGTSGDRQRIDINALVQEALNLAYHGARAQDQNFNITLERDLDSKATPVEVVPQDMLRVFLNLIGNGFYAANKRASEAGDPVFKPNLKVITRDLGTQVEIKVRDNGTGIGAEAREKLFQPFFTTKPTGEGTGLGLSISWDIITQQHGGTITVDSQVGAFTEFTIRLPRPTSLGSSAPPGAREGRGGGLQQESAQ